MLIEYVEHILAYRFRVFKGDVFYCNNLIETKKDEFFEHIFSLYDKTR